MFKLDFYCIFAVAIFTSWLLFIFPNVILAGVPPFRPVHAFVNLLLITQQTITQQTITQQPQSTLEKVRSIFVQGKEWKFSGIGVYILSLIVTAVGLFIAYLFRKYIRKEQWKQQKISLEAKRLQKKWLNNRRSILNVMKSQIKQEIEEVLFKEIVIELDLLKKTDTVEYLRNTVLRHKFLSGKPLPSGTKIEKVFDDLGGSMLILGNPGAGKTTCLLELGRELVKRAERNIDHPIPIILNLSTWAQKRLPFHEWLAGEIVDYYSVPKKVAFGWIKNDDLLVLLDGLDEVVPHYREACVQAINAYQQDRATAGSMVVCSRSEEYCVLNSKLEIHGAVELQPLTDSQIDKYFREIGNEIDDVQKMVENDPVLYKLAHVPLMLNLIILAFHGNPKNSLTPATNVDECRKYIFDTYIHRMLEYHRSEHLSYPTDQTKHWLSWLARKMMEHGQTVFLLEKIQLSWIEHRSDIRLWRLIFRLIMALLSVGIVSVLIVGLFIKPFLGLFMGLFVALLMMLPNTINLENFKIKPIERLQWSRFLSIQVWKEFFFYRKQIIALILGLNLVLFNNLLVREPGHFISELTDLLAVISMFALFLMLIFNLIDILRVEMSPEIIRVLNQGIYYTAIYAIVFGLFSGLFFGLFAELRVGLLIGLSIAVLTAEPCIAHYALRYVLWWRNCMPWNYAKFLEDARNHIFLRKVGGGYRFIHYAIMEHFADMGKHICPMTDNSGFFTRCLHVFSKKTKTDRQR